VKLRRADRLGPYEIVSVLGAGGMGEVYRARDTRLPRNVAIKVLPAELAGDAKLHARLAREARTISALHHPHICMLHDVGHDNGVDYLVLELCEGQSLADRIERGPLSLDETLRYGIELAEALSSAHHAGVVHRDLKPSNIMLTATGVKILDFGLARQRAEGGASTTSSLDGALVGTVAYMAPELLRGEEATPRSDLFAAGAVLYEMLAGTSPFPGSSKAEVIAAILERAPRPLREIQPKTPAALERVIFRCLARDANRRWESAHDLAEELRWIREGNEETVLPVRRRPRLVGALLAVGLAAAVIGSLAGPVVFRRSQPEARRPVVRMTIPVEGGTAEEPAFLRIGHGMSNVALSPDGSRIAYTASRGEHTYLYVREIDSLESVRVPGVDGAASPFFSPDGQWIGFAGDEALQKVRIAGGVPTRLAARSGNMRGAVWAPDGMIYYAPNSNSGLWRVPADGSKPAEQFTQPDPRKGESSHRWPSVLPGGKALLFTIRPDTATTFDDAKLAVLSLETGTWRVIYEGGANARYVDGHLVFTRAGSLYAVPFDLATLSTHGVGRRVVDGIATIAYGAAAADWDVSASGDLIYAPGEVPRNASDLIMVDRSGKSRVEHVLPFTANRPSLAPDWRKIAFNVVLANDDIWIFDRDSGLSNRVSNEPGDETHVVWTPEGGRIIYNASRPPRLVIRNADASGQPRDLAVTPGTPLSCSPDGRWLLYSIFHPETGVDMMLLPLDGNGSARPFLQTRFNEGGGRFSPDGRWVAYAGDEGGSGDIHIRSSNPGGGRLQISTDGGICPRWSLDGRAIFYIEGRRLVEVPLRVDRDEIAAGKPKVLFTLPIPTDWFQVTPEGFLMTWYHQSETPSDRMNVVLNWTRELKTPQR
jgi:Tol biopolymer transport system component